MTRSTRSMWGEKQSCIFANRQSAYQVTDNFESQRPQSLIHQSSAERNQRRRGDRLVVLWTARVHTDAGCTCAVLSAKWAIPSSNRFDVTIMVQLGRDLLVLSVSTYSLLAFGFVLGLKHAVEADHIAAVSTIAIERRSVLSSSLVGALWGLGHTISLLITAVAVMLLHYEISDRMTQSLELCVGVMLVTLGANVLRTLIRGATIHMHVNEHVSCWHAHPHIRDPALNPWRSHHSVRVGPRPLIVGMLHGLAGSAALMLLTATTISSPLQGVFYIAIFGIGSMGGMMIMSTLVSLPAGLTAARYERANVALRGVSGLFSVSLGLHTMYEISIVNHLFNS